MKESLFTSYALEKIKSIPNVKDGVVVLKGIPLNIIDENSTVDIEAAAEKPSRYFYETIVKNERRFITYEEFLLLKSFVFDEYATVHILKNNLYVEQYPIEINFDATTRTKLVKHYEEPETESGESDEEIFLGNLGGIFTGIKEYEGILIGVYNDEGIEDEVKVKTCNLFEPSNCTIKEIDESIAPNFFDIVEESDFVCVVRNILYDAPQNFYFRLNNCVGDKETIKFRLELLQKNFFRQTKIFCACTEEIISGFEHRDEFAQILKKYWGYDSFRKFKVYDLPKLKNGETSTLEISQEQVIANIVQQVENCDGGICRDIFVTAPTGSGKSAIFQVPAIYIAENTIC